MKPMGQQNFLESMARMGVHITEIFLPTGILTGCAVGALFAAVGMFSGMAGSLIFIAPSKLKRPFLLVLPAFAGTLWIIRYSWRGKKTGLAEVSQVSPRLFSVLCALCLGVGFATGVLKGIQSMEPFLD